MKPINDKIKIFTVTATFIIASFMLTGCSKDGRQENMKTPDGSGTTNYTIPLDRSDIDVLAKEIGIAHNLVVFELYPDPDVAGMSATELCHYIHSYLVENIDSMELGMLHNYMRVVESLEDMMGEMYFQIGGLIQNEGSEWYLPDNIDKELIKHSMEDYYDFVNEAFLESDTYDEFEAACMNHLGELCDATSTINDYFYMSACGNITFASYCAWVTIFSGYKNNAKGKALEWLKKNYESAKEFVRDNIVKPLADIVRSDLLGGCIGGGVGLGGATGALLAGASGLVGAGIFAGCWAVGAATGSIISANNK